MEANTIFNLEEKPIAAFNRGVAWSRTGHGRLGHFDSELVINGGVFDNDGKQVAIFKSGQVQSLDGEMLGNFESERHRHQLFLANNEHVGMCIGSHGSAAAAIVFWSFIV